MVVVMVVIVIIAAAGFVALSIKSTSTTNVSTTTTSSQNSSMSSYSSTSSSSSSPSSSSLTTASGTSISSSTTSASSQASTTSSSGALQPINASQFVDYVGTGLPTPSSAPDSLDPEFGFFTYDQPVFNNVYQQLVEFDGTCGACTAVSQLVPVLAQNWTISNNAQTYTFAMRPNAWFSNKDPINAYTVWFSLVRIIYMNAPSGVAPSNYNELTENLSANSPDAEIPMGLANATASLGGAYSAANGSSSQDTAMLVSVLNNMLSNFNPSNSTQQKIMSYPMQAYSAPNSSTFVVNLISPYEFFAQDIAVWWGAVVDPAFVDAHGGVQNNTANVFFSTNGGPGSGPYEISGVGSGFIPVVLKANLNYWAANVSGLAQILQAPHIPTVVIQYGASQSDQINTFASNTAQMTWVGPSAISQLYDAYQYKNEYNISQLTYNGGYAASFQYVASNTQQWPTNITDFRLAIAHALNNSQQIQDVWTNPLTGQPLAENYLGPLLPQSGQYYDPGGLQPYQFNLTLATEEIAAAGQQGGFYVTLPNGTQVGCNSGAVGCKPLPALQLVYISPLSPTTQNLLQIIQANLEEIGVNVAPYGETTAVYSANAGTAATAPVLTWLGWYPDWPDPVFQLLLPAATSTSFLPGWENNATINQIAATLPFITNAAQYLQGIQEIYNILYQQAPYAWYPVWTNYFFLQPYVQGFTWNSYVGYYYNTIYYT
jgi:peptide/nickel transport system substrate-binding protein